MTCGRDDAPGYTCGGGYPKGHPGCGQHFGSLDAFDSHFIKTPQLDADGEPVRRCATAKEMERKGYRLNDSLVWKSPMDEERVARLRGTRPATQQDLLSMLDTEGFAEVSDG